MTSYSTLIRPRDGHTYEATVTYKSCLFTIDIVEIAPQRASSRKLPRQDLSSCATGVGDMRGFRTKVTKRAEEHERLA